MLLKWNVEHEKSKDKNYDESVCIYIYMWYAYIWEYFHCKLTHVMKFVAWASALLPGGTTRNQPPHV